MSYHPTLPQYRRSHAPLMLYLDPCLSAALSGTGVPEGSEKE